MDAILALGVALLVTFVAAALGTAATIPAIRGWYRSLAKPSWTPPDRLFGPVWTLLYVAMAVAAWLVWRERARADITPALSLYAVQLGLNLAWSVVFFGLRRIGAGVVVIALLWCAIAASIVVFLPISALAAALFVPYLVWVSFATALNASIAALSRAASR